ncbi:MAG TPA: hypothetical protein VN668_07955 [Stellaceae bacterium]|nr:hypothetical protein [Stellaceae bacterium]
MEDETTHLRRSIERYRRLLREISDERMRRELEKMIVEAEGSPETDRVPQLT